VRKFADDRQKEGITIDTERVKIGAKLKAFLLFPELPAVAVEAREIGQVVGHQYLQQVAFDPGKKAGATDTGAVPGSKASPAPPPPIGFATPELRPGS
jgi:hypothetical protein